MPSNKIPAIDISMRTLREWPLPLPNFDSDKEAVSYTHLTLPTKA